MQNVLAVDCRAAVCISMAATQHHGLYRFSSHGHVFYVEAHENSILKSDEYGFPPVILGRLPPRPLSCNWADIKDEKYGEWRTKKLKEVQQCWHPERIDLGELEAIKYFNECVCRCVYKPQPVVANIARFEFEIQYIERESAAYRVIDGKNIGPRFLGYLTENGRVMGVLLEHIAPRSVLHSADLELCPAALRKLHKFQILLNDSNFKYNFLVTPDGKTALICDFANSKIGVDDERLLQEENDLAKALEDNAEDWSDFGQERVRSMSTSEYKI